MNVLKSKTTLNGLLALVISFCIFVGANPTVLGVSPKIAGWLAVIAGVGRAIVGILQKDADTVSVQLGGQAEMVPAHPTPDDPKLAKSVITPIQK